MAEQKKMNVMQLTILTGVNMMGSGIVMLPTKLASVGTISVFSWVVTALGSMALAYVFAKCGRFSRNTAAGMGGYAEYAFGKAGSHMVNYTYAFSLVVANVAIAISAVGYGETFLENAAQTFNFAMPAVSDGSKPLITAILAIVLIWLTTAANFGGASVTGKIGTFTIWGIIAPVLGLSILGWFWFSPSTYVSAWNPHNFGFWSAVGMSIPMTLWAFLGLESACANSDAVENPEKNVPIAVLGGTLGAAIIYIASTNVMAGIVPNADLASSNAPFGLVFSMMFGPVVGLIVIGLMVIACIGSLLGWQFTVAQVFKSSAQEKYFLEIFAKVNDKGVPIIPMVILASAQTLLALMTVSPQLSAQFEQLTNLAVVTNVVPYIICMASIVAIFAVSNVRHRDEIITYVVALIASIYSFYALYSTGPTSMMYGALVTFLGWTLFASVSHRFIKAHEPLDTSLIDAMERAGDDKRAQIKELESYLDELKRKETDEGKLLPA
jgi:Amino acid transporters